ncbi:MAG: leucine-rich repeat domain-containing protein [Treponemataceae bacterium]|nr:leucine-rich repeat domain-containing protein [Treponemataceae bacterium]
MLSLAAEVAGGGGGSYPSGNDKGAQVKNPGSPVNDEEVDISQLSAYLAAKPTNTKESAYSIKITGLTTSNYNDIKSALTANPTKYVDLSATALPNGITVMKECFMGCNSLVQSPAIPNSVTNMSFCFSGCSFTQAPVIPNSVTNMEWCFFWL